MTADDQSAYHRFLLTQGVTVTPGEGTLGWFDGPGLPVMLERLHTAGHRTARINATGEHLITGTVTLHRLVRFPTAVIGLLHGIPAEQLLFDRDLPLTEPRPAAGAESAAAVLLGRLIDDRSGGHTMLAAIQREITGLGGSTELLATAALSGS
jgi:hypothetical protein